MITRKSMILEDGSSVQAICPVIVSASRCTDIPAFLQIGSFIDYRLVIQYGLIRSMERKAIYLTMPPGSSFSGPRIRYRYFLFSIFSI